MKFTERKYPILQHLGGYQSLLYFTETGLQKKFIELGKEFITQLAHFCNYIALEGAPTIDYLSAPLFDRIRSEQLFPTLTKLFNTLQTADGVLLYPPKYFSKIHASTYSIFQKDGEILGEIHLYGDHGRVAILYFSTEEGTVKFHSVMSDSRQQAVISEELAQNWFINHIQTVLATIAFKQYAEIETLHIGGRKYPKRGKIQDEKYLNDSKHQVNVLDSRWFRETIRTEGFQVSGHFRLQACGPNHSERKLIYIKDFMKQGYHRRARKGGGS